MKQLNDKKLLELIKTDVKGFNAYREEYPNQEINFKDAYLFVSGKTFLKDYQTDL
jgi:hypothetical protein